MNKNDLDHLRSTLPEKNNNPPEFAVKMLEDFVERTGLNWKDRQCYLMCRGGKWRVEVSIDGFRTIASRNPLYSGQDGPFWTTGPNDPWTDIPPEKAPYAAKVGIRQTNHAEPTWGVAKYTDYAAGPMWVKFASTMSAKVAEALALRKAFPGDFSGVYSAEEMMQADRPAAPKGRPPGVPDSSAAKPVERVLAGPDTMDVELEAIQACSSLEELKAYRSAAKDRLSGSIRLKLSPAWEAKKKEFSTP